MSAIDGSGSSGSSTISSTAAGRRLAIDALHPEERERRPRREPGLDEPLGPAGPVGDRAPPRARAAPEAHRLREVVVERVQRHRCRRRLQVHDLAAGERAQRLPQPARIVGREPT
jgi:hypothetical protein